MNIRPLIRSTKTREFLARADRAYWLRSRGATWLEVSRELSVGRQRAYQIVQKYKRILGIDEPERKRKPEEDLSPRAYNCLQCKFNYTEITPTKVASLSRKELLRTPNLGKKTLKEIEEWLAHYKVTLRPESRPPYKGWILAYEEYNDALDS